jgi:hypothetical protein
MARKLDSSQEPKMQGLPADDYPIEMQAGLVMLAQAGEKLSPRGRRLLVRDLLQLATEHLESIAELEADDETIRLARACQSCVSRLAPDSEALRKVPKLNERALAAIQCRDNIANTLEVDTTATGAVNCLRMALALPEGYGARFLLNKSKLAIQERVAKWTKKTKDVLERADVNTHAGRLRAATRIVMRCAEAEGLTANDAKNLLKRDPAGVALAKREQFKRVRKRD